jgi:O-succinylhomoserine sulfhydrylase
VPLRHSRAPAALRRAIDAGAWPPANPTLEVIDIAAVAAIAKEAGAKLVVDNVFSSPIWQKPFELGADCVVYSATKHIDGQGRCLGGVILGSEAFIQEHIHTFLRQTGPALSPFNAWVLLKSLETLPLRVEKQTRTAGEIADALAGHPKITRLIYPGRGDHPQADIIARQMRGGSNLIALEISGGKGGAFRFQNALRVIKISNNLGDAKSLITHPATTTHQRFTPADRAEMGVTDGLVRLSVGLEHRDDLIADLLQALDRA